MKQTRDRPSDFDQEAGAYVTLKQLQALEGAARRLTFRPTQPVTSLLNGRHASRLRGRGLDFDEIRGYLPGDDIRTIDWKVTARIGAPHVRVYTEERDRPALLIVDQRMPMFFGSVLNLKSVTAAEAASVAAFAILSGGDRVGGLVLHDEGLSQNRPQRSRRALNGFLTEIVHRNRNLRATGPNNDATGDMDTALETAVRLAGHDHLIIVFSDFDGITDHTRRHVSQLARHNDVLLCVVTDPMAQELPPNLRIVMSDGTLQAEISTHSGPTHKALRELVTGRMEQVLGWEQELGIPVLPLTSGEETGQQLHRLLGRLRDRRARK
jgi:uncharacterized protein (DUF58 family)